MPYKSVWEERGVLTKWWGNATTFELLQMQEQVHATPNFDVAHYSIHDFSECGHFAYDRNDIEYSAAIDGAASTVNSKVKIAIVAANPEVIDVVKTYMEESLSPYPVRFFSSVEEAREWAQ